MFSARPPPGFYAGGSDHIFFVSPAGDVWEVEADGLRVSALPAHVEPVEHELPSMLLRVAAHLGLVPAGLRGLSDDALDLLDEVFWDGQFGAELPGDVVAELAQAGVNCDASGRLSELFALSRAVRGPQP
ncbi:hypothetical protein [Nannocystis pusilla]|uniref:Uncharacterized protein n=1 Tax=Nannocystis pusilla TaxID=889268 RepID=A0ABS7TN46_9BACT|nr:hypothetical protein [Nannocystis pusilla]MBZ5709643.1 hypothetical protein [Nannocystis pusilla]